MPILQALALNSTALGKARGSATGTDRHPVILKKPLFSILSEKQYFDYENGTWALWNHVINRNISFFWSILDIDGGGRVKSNFSKNGELLGYKWLLRKFEKSSALFQKIYRKLLYNKPEKCTVES